MKKYKTIFSRWALASDLELPIYKIWRKEHQIKVPTWQALWVIPFLSSHIPKGSNIICIGEPNPEGLGKLFPNTNIISSLQELNSIGENEFEYTISIAKLNGLEDPINWIKETIRITKQKVILVFEIEPAPEPQTNNFQMLGQFLGKGYPEVPPSTLDSTDIKLSDKNNRRLLIPTNSQMLSIGIEAAEAVKKVGIIIPHWESYPFISAAIHRIKLHKNPNIDPHIYIVDDASQDGSIEKLEEISSKDPTITIFKTDRPNKNTADVGWLLDYALQRIQEPYVCMIDADLLPIDNDWLAFPIWLLEKYACSSVGCDTGLSNAYLNKCPGKWNNSDGYIPKFGVYGNDQFTCTNNFFRVMKTSLAKIVSEQIGFSRRSSRIDTLRHRKFYRRLNRLLPDPRPTKGFYCPPNCDNGVAANHFIDINKLGAKFNIPILSWVGFTLKDGVFGQNICNLVLHFALSTRVLSRWRREIQDAGQEYYDYANRIMETGLDDTLIDEMLSKCTLRPGGYDGSIPVSWYQEQQEAFQHEYRQFLEERNVNHPI